MYILSEDHDVFKLFLSITEYFIENVFSKSLFFPQMCTVQAYYKSCLCWTLNINFAYPAVNLETLKISNCNTGVNGEIHLFCVTTTGYYSVS